MVESIGVLIGNERRLLENSFVLIIILSVLRTIIRPLQFNYLSYKLFLGKKILSDSKKKKKKKEVNFGESGLEILCQTPKKSLRIFIVRGIQSTTGILYRYQS